MLFGRPIFVSCVLMGAALAATFFLHVQVRPSDALKYRKLVRESSELHSRRALERKPAHQLREQVQKDIWTIDGKERPHFRLNSDYSELTLHQKKGKFEAVEEFQQINCWIQEKVDSVSQRQQLRTLTASEGTYYYPSHRFLAHSVHLHFYRLFGSEFPLCLTEKPFLTGVAREASFSAMGKTPTFTAYDITASLDPEKWAASP